MEQETERDFNASAHTYVGSADMSIGFKIALTHQAHVLPEMGIIVEAFVPAGSDHFTADETLPRVAWTYAWEIGEGLLLEGQTMIARKLDHYTDEAYSEFSQAVGVKAELIDDLLASYVEWYALAPHSADTEHTQHVFEGGFMVLLTRNLQWDVEAGVGLNDAAHDYFVGTGFSYRR